MQTLDKILVVFLIWTCQQVQIMQGTNYKTVQYKKITSNSKLNGNVISTHQDVTLQKCAVIGIENLACPAFNFLNTSMDTKTGTCEILGVDQDDGALVAANGYTYYEMHKVDPDRCIPNPCLRTGICKNIDTISGPDFHCNCPFPLGGKICADLICETCERVNDLVVFWNITKSLSWMESYEYCQSRGWTLYLDKTQAKHDLAVKIATKLFPSKSVEVCFWIGLNRTKGVFKFIDGTKLKSFAPWSGGRPESDDCVEIANSDSFLWNWDDEECAPAGSWKYYPLCEKNYTFLL